MKKIIYKVALLFCAATTLYSCSLDEYNPAAITADDSVGWKGLLNYCYTPLYSQLFSATDYLGVAEAGTDIWLTANNKTNTQQLFYYEGMNTSTNGTKKLFTQAYSMINSCNAVINRSVNITDAPASEVKQLTAEAHCLRAYYYLLLTTHYGNITLNLKEATEGLVMRPQRNTIEEIYAQIIDDLKLAVDGLEVKPYKNNYARVCKKTALGLLARVYAQGAGEGLKENGKSYWERAKEVSEDLITNMDAYGAYLYQDVAEVWSHANNRSNKEALFVASGPQAGTPAYEYGSASNKLFAYTMANPYKLNDVYKHADKANYLYGRVNSGLFAPSKYLIDCFDATYDKRWENSFVTAFANFSMVQPAWSEYEKQIVTLTADICRKYGIAAEHIGKKIYPYADVKAINRAQGGNQYVASVWPKGDYSADVKRLQKTNNAYAHTYPLSEDENRFPIYLSKEPLSAAQKARRAYVCINIDDLFDGEGNYKANSFDGTESYQLFPSLSKFNWSYDGMCNGSNLQIKTGDMFIMRMAEVYLIAAEANQQLGNGEKAAGYLNVLRKRACRNAADFESHMKLTTATEDDIFDEYARELCGEFGRWALLKRHKAFETRLPKYNKRAAQGFNASLHYLRPISYDFLNQIENGDEYGTNGY